MNDICKKWKSRITRAKIAGIFAIIGGGGILGWYHTCRGGDQAPISQSNNGNKIENSHIENSNVNQINQSTSENDSIHK